MPFITNIAKHLSSKIRLWIVSYYSKGTSINLQSSGNGTGNGTQNGSPECNSGGLISDFCLPVFPCHSLVIVVVPFPLPVFAMPSNMVAFVGRDPTNDAKALFGHVKVSMFCLSTLAQPQSSDTHILGLTTLAHNTEQLLWQYMNRETLEAAM